MQPRPIRSFAPSTPATSTPNPRLTPAVAWAIPEPAANAAIRPSGVPRRPCAPPTVVIAGNWLQTTFAAPPAQNPAPAVAAKPCTSPSSPPARSRSATSTTTVVGARPHLTAVAPPLSSTALPAAIGPKAAPIRPAAPPTSASPASNPATPCPGSPAYSPAAHLPRNASACTTESPTNTCAPFVSCRLTPSATCAAPITPSKTC